MLFFDRARQGEGGSKSRDTDTEDRHSPATAIGFGRCSVLVASGRDDKILVVGLHATLNGGPVLVLLLWVEQPQGIHLELFKLVEAWEGVGEVFEAVGDLGSELAGPAETGAVHAPHNFVKSSM